MICLIENWGRNTINWYSNYALGNEAFAQKVELVFGRKATAGKAGRTRKDED